jgi:hypothetical protein
VKIHTRVLAPIWHGLPPSAADDKGAVEEVFRKVHGVMQAAMEELRREGRHGLFPRAGGRVEAAPEKPVRTAFAEGVFLEAR